MQPQSGSDGAALFRAGAAVLDLQRPRQVEYVAFADAGIQPWTVDDLRPLLNLIGPSHTSVAAVGRLHSDATFLHHATFLPFTFEKQRSVIVTTEIEEAPHDGARSTPILLRFPPVVLLNAAKLSKAKASLKSLFLPKHAGLRSAFLFSLHLAALSVETGVDKRGDEMIVEAELPTLRRPDEASSNWRCSLTFAALWHPSAAERAAEVREVAPALYILFWLAIFEPHRLLFFSPPYFSLLLLSRLSSIPL